MRLEVAGRDDLTGGQAAQRDHGSRGGGAEAVAVDLDAGPANDIDHAHMAVGCGVGRSDADAGEQGVQVELVGVGRCGVAS